MSGLLLSGCTSWGNAETNQAVDNKEAKAKALAAAQKDRAAKLAVAAKVGANELGRIPVLMYHRIVKKPSLPDDRTPTQFRAELERLAKEGYVPITAAEYVTGNIGIPAGKHAVVLTLDDSSPSQLTLDGVGRPAPDTAVAILREVAAAHEGFRPVATFYVTRDMFGLTSQTEHAQALGWLKQNGFDIGNHTRSHADLRGKSKGQVTKEIVSGHTLITDLVDQDPITFALPYGNQPKNEKWALSGKASGMSYKYGGVFLAGYEPGASPYSTEFDPVAVPRIRAMGKVGDCKRFCSAAWLDKLKANRDTLYTSDGDPATVAAPKFQETRVAKRFKNRALLYEIE